MNNQLRITVSGSVFAVAILHAIALVGGFYTVNKLGPNQTPSVVQPSFIDAQPQHQTSYQYLPQPEIAASPVNRSALDEVKQQAPPSRTEELKSGRYVRNNNTGELVWCPSCSPQPTYVQPYVQPAPAPPAPFVNTPPQSILQPGTAIGGNTLPAPKKYELALFVGSDARSQQLLQWFNTDPTLMRVKAVSNFQVYTKDSPLYKTRYASTMPADQFPAYVFQWADGAHIHAGGGNFLAPNPQKLFSDLQEGMKNSKSIREQPQMSGLIREAGYSWDRAIAPNMQLPSLQYLNQFTQLGLQDCDGPECRFPRKPDGGGPLDDLWNKQPQAMAWIGPGEIVTIALVVVACGLVIAIVKKHS